MRDIPQPIIAAVQGAAVGAGFALAAASDIRVCAPDAKFMAPFLKLGVSIGDLGLSWMLPRLIGAGAAAEILYTGRTLGAEEARELRFVQHVVDEPLPKAIELAAKIAARPRLGVQMSKELLNASIGAGGLPRASRAGVTVTGHRPGERGPSRSRTGVLGWQGQTVSRIGYFMTEIRFDDQVAIVTGAGHGLGRTYALELARRGAAVVVNDLGVDSHGIGSGPAANVVVEEIKNAGGRAVANTDSVASPEGGQAVVDAAVDEFGRVDIVINNAGILRDKSFSNLTFQEMDDIIDVHLRGAFFVSQPAFRKMREQKYGRFLFTTSAAGLFGNFGQTNYSAAKMGLVGLSNTIAIEGAKNGIHSNAIAPIARTRLTEELLGPMAEMLHPEFVTPLALYLCSRECELTHEIFSVGAGRYSRAFVGVSDGWFSGKGNVPSVEDVAGHITEIRDVENYIIPDNAQGELAVLAPLLS